MNFRRIEYFMVLAEVGNLRGAAEMLHVSAPALSKAMKLLELEMEASLWIRDGRKIVLTDTGKVLLRKSQGLMHEFKNLRENLNKEDSAKPICIGTFEVFSTYFLGSLAKAFGGETNFSLHELLPGEVEKYCLQGDIKFGITYMPVPDPQLDFLKVGSIEMGVFTKQGAFQGVRQEELPFVIPVVPLQGVPTKVRGLDGWPEDAYQRKVTQRVTLLESALELCRQGKVAGYFPAFIVDEHNQRVREDFRLERRKSPYGERKCRSDVFIVKRKSTEEDKVVKRLAKALRFVCS